MKSLIFSMQRSRKLSDIPVKVPKANFEMYLKDLTAIISDCLEKGVFPTELKLADTVDSQYNEPRRKTKNSSLYREFVKSKIEKNLEFLLKYLKNPV